MGFFRTFASAMSPRGMADWMNEPEDRYAGTVWELSDEELLARAARAKKEAR
jgi:hypothetical protein